jgi:hypothetical protein
MHLVERILRRGKGFKSFLAPKMIAAWWWGIALPGFSTYLSTELSVAANDLFNVHKICCLSSSSNFFSPTKLLQRAYGGTNTNTKMESLSDTVWDVVICGTGLQQSLLAL